MNFLKDSKKLYVATILFSIKIDGSSIDLSTCVSAARLKIAIGSSFNKILFISSC
mgnify:CR=1 FL=1